MSLWLLLAVACTPRPHAPLVCDTGSSSVAFGYVVDTRSGEELIRANGTDFLYITRDCRYFVQPAGGVSAWEPVHTGILDETELEELNGSLLTQPWAALVDRGSPIPPSPDGPIQFMQRDDVRVYCTFDCGDAREALVEAVAWSERLYGAGAPLAGDVWIISDFLTPRAENPPIVAAVGFDGLSVFRAGRARIGGADADVLRAIRDEVLRRPAFPFYPYVPVLIDGEAWSLHMRDALPIEDASGFVYDPSLSR